MSPPLARVVGEQPAVGLEVRMEGEAQEPALAAVLHLARDVEEVARDQLVVLDDADGPGLLDDEQAAGPVTSVDDTDR